MIKTYIFGLILGIAGAVGLIYSVPAVDLHREASQIDVLPNGGNSETFHINLPHDRILAGSRSGGRSSVFPESVEWPDNDDLDGSQTEIFKIRNGADRVVGVAARVSSVSDSSGSFIHWMLHVPARGTMFAGMDLGTSATGARNGLLLAGTREFETLNGRIVESYNNDLVDEYPDISGRLELETMLVGALGELE